VFVVRFGIVRLSKQGARTQVEYIGIGRALTTVMNAAEEPSPLLKMGDALTLRPLRPAADGCPAAPISARFWPKKWLLTSMVKHSLIRLVDVPRASGTDLSQRK
jgi:hypothetical protein